MGEDTGEICANKKCECHSPQSKEETAGELVGYWKMVLEKHTNEEGYFDLVSGRSQLEDAILAEIEAAEKRGYERGHAFGANSMYITNVEAYKAGQKQERERILAFIESQKTPADQCITGFPCEFKNGALMVVEKFIKDNE